jgi:hypothetical protein
MVEDVIEELGGSSGEISLHSASGLEVDEIRAR